MQKGNFEVISPTVIAQCHRKKHCWSIPLMRFLPFFFVNNLFSKCVKVFATIVQKILTTLKTITPQHFHCAGVHQVRTMRGSLHFLNRTQAKHFLLAARRTHTRQSRTFNQGL
jgi:hypothetical protein